MNAKDGKLTWETLTCVIIATKGHMKHRLKNIVQGRLLISDRHTFASFLEGAHFPYLLVQNFAERSRFD